MLGTRVGKRRLLAAGGVLLAGFGSLPDASIALAGGASRGVHLQSRYWLVSINHQVTKVPADGKVVYCASDFVESMTPRLVLTASSEHIHYYAYHILDPHKQRSTNIYASFRGRRDVVERAFVPLMWAKAEARETNPPFRPGTYTLQVALNAQIIRGHPHGGKMQAIERLTLEPKKTRNVCQ